MDTKKLFRYVKILSLFGILLAIYLLWQQVYRPAFAPCTINASINCDAVISGDVSKTFGIPTPLYGLTGYIIIFFAALYKRRNLLLGMAVFGLVFCLWIAYRELFELKVICPVCIGCQLIMIAIFILAVIIYKKTHHANQRLH
jgi:uncharacterized membrane protein